jgi:serine/threonine protein kinase
MEFEGVKLYKPVSEKHPALLRVEYVSPMKAAGYFYYVMELADAVQPGWENNPALYQARTLERLRQQSPGTRLPVRECVRVGIALAEALDFLHSQNLTHRDVKPSNVIFVNGRPKLADIGLVTEARLPDQEGSRPGTLNYMPPPPEPQGTRQADLYALGMLLYVISTGRDPAAFPDLSSTLLDHARYEEFSRLDKIITRACHPDLAIRHASAAEFRDELMALQTWLDRATVIESTPTERKGNSAPGPAD